MLWFRVSWIIINLHTDLELRQKRHCWKHLMIYVNFWIWIITWYWWALTYLVRLIPLDMIIWLESWKIILVFLITYWNGLDRISVTVAKKFSLIHITLTKLRLNTVFPKGRSWDPLYFASMFYLFVMCFLNLTYLINFIDTLFYVAANFKENDFIFKEKVHSIIINVYRQNWN